MFGFSSLFRHQMAVPAIRMTAESPWAASQQFASPGKPWTTAVGREVELEAPGARTEPGRAISPGIPMICSQSHSLNPRLRSKNHWFHGFIFNTFISNRLTHFIYGTYEDGNRNTREWPNPNQKHHAGTAKPFPSRSECFKLSTQTATTEHDTAEYNQLPHFQC